MTELIELSNSKHGKLKVAENAAVTFIQHQHMLKVHVKEITQAISGFPVFIVKNSQTGMWNLSALASFNMGKNLFVHNDKWDAIFTPASMHSYPFYLMNSAGENKGYTIGIAPSDPVFSTVKGLDIFESTGKASLMLSRIKTLLEADIKNDIQSYLFTDKLASMQLIKSINLVVQYKDGAEQTLTGMNTIDEAKLQQLSNDELAELNKLGYLMPIHAMLMSIFQLNNLIRKHNHIENNKLISQVKLALE
ncbi:SapC family protein [Colwellia sp. MB3u-70]|uniref:SapC family protein n=1 Tax=unclassified Colwellia TaxID=196834 RepID=UPI0015F5CB1F|nr:MULTISPECIES: SapC family protein [unclassified Colwellia]MBA6291114.1 SapC family protein [Colwellia sp. MB3u-8]MBA6308167.1 SapC family protein [Colwellia sp. MB3u-70]